MHIERKHKENVAAPGLLIRTVRPRVSTPAVDSHGNVRDLVPLQSDQAPVMLKTTSLKGSLSQRRSNMIHRMHAMNENNANFSTGNGFCPAIVTPMTASTPAGTPRILSARFAWRRPCPTNKLAPARVQKDAATPLSRGSRAGLIGGNVRGRDRARSPRVGGCANAPPLAG